MNFQIRRVAPGAIMLFIALEAVATEPITINPSSRALLFDGHCGEAEWEGANRFDLPAQAAILLMHDENFLFVCARGKAQDFTVIDLYIRNSESGQLHNLHASAQLGEKVLVSDEWGETEHWGLQGWGGFWVPYAGAEETEEGTRTRFLRGSHREIQVLRTKFPGDNWTMMIGVSAVEIEDSLRGEFFYPEQAVNTDASTWETFTFSD